MAQQTISKMETVQTAVEWLVKELKLEGYDYTVEQAKAMEKEQIMNAYGTGVVAGAITDEFYENSYEVSEQYYNETYGSNN